MKNIKDFSGIGGWLSILIVIMILSPLSVIQRFINEFSKTEKIYPQLVVNAQWLQYKQISWLIIVFSIAFSFTAGYRLWKFHFPNSVLFAIIALWISGPLGNLLHTVTAIALFGSQALSVALPEMFGGIIGSCIGAGIWTAYLVRSSRVKNTYNYKLNVLKN